MEESEEDEERQEKDEDQDEEAKDEDQQGQKENEEAEKEAPPADEDDNGKEDDKPKVPSEESGVDSDEAKEDELVSPDKSEHDDGDSDDDIGEQQQQQVRNTSLKRMAMAGNGVNDAYLTRLLAIFASNTTGGTYSSLEELDLSENNLTNAGLEKLLNSLPQFPYLQRLYLRNQQLRLLPKKIVVLVRIEEFESIAVI